MKILYFFALSLLVCSQQSFGQSIRVNTTYAQATWRGYQGDEQGPRVFFYKNSESDINLLTSSCLGFGTAQANTVYPNVILEYVYVTSSDPVFNLVYRTFEKRAGNGSASCYYNDSGGGGSKPDRYETRSNYSIDMRNYPPGASFNYTVTNFAGGSVFTSYLKIAYTPPVHPAPTGENGQHCSNDNFTIATTNPLGAPANTSGLTYKWEYHIEGVLVTNPAYGACRNRCSDIEDRCLERGGGSTNCVQDYHDCLNNCDDNVPKLIDSWLTLTTTSLPSLSFNPLEDVFSGTLTGNKRVQFRVTAVGPELSSAASSSSTFFTFLVPPPNSSSDVVVERSCIDPTGKISLENISSVNSNYQYALKKGDLAALNCNPEKSECLVDIVKNGQGSGGLLTISEIPYGTYSLFLLNSGQNLGVCPRRIGGPIFIDTFRHIGVNPLVHADLICNGLNTGSARVTIQDGKPDNVLYTLTNKTILKDYTLSSNTENATVVFDGLAAGDHTLIINDGCTKPFSAKFVIQEPVKVSVSDFQYSDATCNDPGNGIAKVDLVRTSTPYTKTLSAINNFKIFKNNSLYSNVESPDLKYQWTTLPPDSYYMILGENGGLACNSDTVDFAIAGAALIEVKKLQTTDVLCFNGSEGAISIEGKGGTNLFAYELTGAETRTSLTGIFSLLKAGDYAVTIKNTIACNDKFVMSPIKISQPTQVSPEITKTDITCFGFDNGEITSDVEGGTVDQSGYTYTWETLINNSWTALSKTTDDLTDLSQGIYRLKASDRNSCIGVSNEATIVEPTALIIEKTNLLDVICKNDNGTISIIPNGGTSPYTFEYSKDNQAYQIFTSTTPLNEGSYRVAVVDKNNCRNDDPNSYSITQPPAALTFTRVLSDYNGYNISCFGGSNGYVSISASGGNGSVYSGYNYSVDNSLYVSVALQENINAGNHAVHVKDGRGCIVTEDILFTQTTAELIPKLLSKQDVICFGDKTGTLNFGGDGGLLPYQYTVDNSVAQASGTFKNLATGRYLLTLTDKNNCSASLEESISSVNPVIEIDSIVQNVNCFGGKDGSITTVVSGGVPPFQFSWPSLSANTSAVTGLKAGNYSVTVTDNAGCKMSSLMTIAEPEHALLALLKVFPVCYGKTNGSITALANGGTAPYQFSIDGQQYQNGNLFSTVDAGSHTVVTKDSHGCTSSNVADVIQRNDKPEPNFLAATKRNALDTLVITDISVPKPDSIKWQFVPAPEILDDNMWAPLIRYNAAGTYTIMLTGYFSGCDYTIVKDLYVSPFDPNAPNEKVPGYKPIQSVTVTPNPSDGNFEVHVVLNKKRNVSMLVYDMVGAVHYNSSLQEVTEVKKSISLNDVASGIYLVRIVAETDAEDVRIVINK